MWYSGRPDAAGLGGVAGPRKGWGCGGMCGQLSARRVGPGFPGAGASSLQSGLTSHSVISFPPTLYLFVFGLWCAVPLFCYLGCF